MQRGRRQVLHQPVLSPGCELLASHGFARRSEARANLLGKELRLFPGSLAALPTRDHPCGNRLPHAVAKLALVGDEVGIFAVHELIAMRLD